MATQLRFAGKSVEEALAKARSQCGPGAKIVFAQKVKTKGVIGFGKAYRFELVVENTLPAAEQNEGHSLFAEELRLALRDAPLPPEEFDTFISSRRTSPLDRYRQSEQLAPLPEQDFCAIVEPPLEVEASTERPEHVRVFKRDGTSALTRQVGPPPWVPCSESTETVSLSPFAAPFGGLLDAEDDRFRSLRSGAWAGLVDSRVDPLIIDLTRQRSLTWGPVRSQDKLEASTRDDNPFHALHDLPCLYGQTIVIFAGRRSFEQGRTFSSVCEIYAVDGRDRFSFSSSTEVEIWCPDNQRGPAEMLETLERGRSIGVWVDDNECAAVLEAFDGHRCVVIAQVDLSQGVEENQPYLASLPLVSALSLSGVRKSERPAAAFELGLPVATVDGRISTESTWITLMISKGAS